MIRIKKQRAANCGKNKGINITRGKKGNFGINLSKDVVSIVSPYVEIAIDGDKLYLVDSDQRDGFKVTTKRDCGTGRFDINNASHFKAMQPFVGNHYAYRDEMGVYIRPERRL